MIIFTPLQFENSLKEGVAQWVMNRGWKLLYDGGGYEEMIPQFVKLEVHHAVMTKEEYENTVNDFFFHNIWAFKKLRRGELWSAKMCIDGISEKFAAENDRAVSALFWRYRCMA